MTRQSLTRAQLESEIVSAIETIRDIEGVEPTRIEVMDHLCDEMRKARIGFDETSARTIIAAKVAK